MFCSQCGVKLDDNAKFCTSCGVAVAISSAAPAHASLGGGIKEGAPEKTVEDSSATQLLTASGNLSAKEIIGGLALGIMVVAGMAYHQAATKDGSGIWSLFSFKAGPGDQATVVVKRQLRSPSSFKHVSSKVIWTGRTQKAEPAYVVAVGYDAQNSFGAALRGCMLVAYYEAADGQIGWNEMFGARESESVFCSDSTPTSMLAEMGNALAEANSFATSGSSK